MLASKRILDLTWVLGGPFAGQLLSQLGAEVIKVETLDGDPARDIPPYFFEGDSSFFLSANRGKQSVAVDLRSAEGMRVFHDLVRSADAVIYGFAPDVPRRLGIDYESLRAVNPDIRVGELIGLHDDAEYARTPAYDIVVQALSGLMHITGSQDGPPSRVGYQVADLAGGLYLALGTCAALVDDGGSRHFTVSLLDCQVALLNWQAQNYLFSGKEPERLGSRSPNIAPSEAFECADGRYLAVSPTGAHFWGAFCAAIDRPELASDPRFATRTGRLENVAELASIIGEVLAGRPAHEWEEHFREKRIPAARVQTVSEALDHPVTQRRAMVETIRHPRTQKPLRVLGNPFKYESSAPLRYPSRHGTDTRRVLRELGYDDAAIDKLATSDAIRLGDSDDLAD
jgi:formyl-CoA transferase